MTSIYKRKDSPYYWMSYTIRGRRVIKSTKVKDKKLAELVMNDAMRRELLPKSDKPLAEIKDEFLAYLEPRVSDDWYLVLKTRMKQFTDSMDNKGIGGIRVADIEDYMSMILKTDSPSTANRKVGLVSRFYRFAISRDYCQKDPTIGVDRIALDPSNPRFFSDDEIKKVFKNGDEYKDFYTLLLHTGFRSKDAGELKWKSVDIKNKRISILSTKKKRPHVIPMNTSLLKLLNKKPNGEYVLPRFTNRRERKKARLHLQSFLGAGVGLHTFRHTCASIMIQRGASIYDVSKYLGHSSIVVTQIYAHLQEHHLRKASDLLVT